MGKDQDLLEAARSGNVAVVEKILGQRAKRSGPLASLRRGPGANVQDSSGYSSLHHAALNGHKEIVKLLLEHDASTNIMDSKGSTPLHLAAWSGNQDIVRLLLSGHGVCNVNLTNKDDETALHCAAQYGHTPVVCLLLEYNCDAGIRNARGETALDLAAQYGRLETVELLVRSHPSLIHHMQRIIPGTVFPHTPLHLASRNGHRMVVEVLLRAGLDVNIRTPAGTALHEAALCGKVEVVKCLLECGVDVHIRDAHNYTVRDLLSQFPANATQEIMGYLKRHKKHRISNFHADSDGESFTQPFPPVQQYSMDPDLGSPYENVRPCSRGRSMTTDPSPGSSPHRWGDFRHARSMDAVEDRRISGTSIRLRAKSQGCFSKPNVDRLGQVQSMHALLSPGAGGDYGSGTVGGGGGGGGSGSGRRQFQGIAYLFSRLLHDLGLVTPHTQQLVDGGGESNRNQHRLRHQSDGGSSYETASECSRESELGGVVGAGSGGALFHFPGVPKQFMDDTQQQLTLPVGVDDVCVGGGSHYALPPAPRDMDRISLSSTASSSSYYPRRPDSNSHYVPMKGGAVHSPGSHSKVSPTPPKKPPRRNLSVSPTHLQSHMSTSADSYSNNAYEMMYLAHTGGTRSQGNLSDDVDSSDQQQPPPQQRREQRLIAGRSVDQYVEMNTVFSINLDEEDERPATMARELQRGKSEDLDSMRNIGGGGGKHEPVAITSVYENMVVKQQNPRRKLRRNHDVYEDYDLATAPRAKQDDNLKTCSSAPETTFVSSAFIMVKDSYDDGATNTIRKNTFTPLSPTHYKQPPTPDHPPPSAVQAENVIYDKIRPLSQEYKRRSKDMETETEDDYLFVYEGSSGSFSSSVSLSDKSTDHVEEYHSDAPFAGLIKGAKKASKAVPAERPKTLKKLRRVYDSSAHAHHAAAAASASGAATATSSLSSADNNGKSNDSQKSSSSGSDKESENKENRDRMCTLSPFDEQEEWAKIQEIMASFGTGLVRESVFVSELEKEFQSRLLSLGGAGGAGDAGGSQNSLTPAASLVVVSADDDSASCSVDKWLQSLDMADYVGLFIAHGFDDIGYLNGVLDDVDLKEMGVASDDERATILNACKLLPLKICAANQCHNNNVNEASDVENWLHRIHLAQYSETFAKHLYHDMERIRRIWDVELSAVLDIEKVGHRKRILASVSVSGEHVSSGPKMEEINADLSVLKNNIHQLKSEMRSPSAHTPNNSGNTGTLNTGGTNTGTIRHRHKKSRPAPPPPVSAANTSTSTAAGTTATTTTATAAAPIPIIQPPKKDSVLSELSVGGGGSNTIKSQWRHQPILLITGVVKYNVYYLGSTLVREFKGTESTKRSIQKIRRSTETVPKEILLAISYRALKFIDIDNQVSICEHDIKNVNSACQDPDLKSYFAYITKDADDFYCHVFSTETSEHATDIILTLGQAYELAYQMALRDQVTSKCKTGASARNAVLPSSGNASDGGGYRGSAVSPCSVSSQSSRDFKDSSKADLKLNGHPLRMMPLTLSIAAAEPNLLVDHQQQQQQQLHHHSQRTPTHKAAHFQSSSDIEA